MRSTWKKWICMALSCLLLVSLLSACGEETPKATEKAPEATTAAPTEAKEDPVLKVLTIGNSGAVDTCHMLNLVAGAEGFEREMVIGTLYSSGCSLSRHVENLRGDVADYSLFVSNSKTPNEPPTQIEEATMYYALRYTDWDVVVFQGSTATNYKKTTFTTGDLQTLQRYVKENQLNPDAIFMWHMYCANPADVELQTKWEIQTGKGEEKNGYKAIYRQFANRDEVFAAITANVKEYILTDESFAAVIPSGTAVENALTSYMTEPDLHRDYLHLTDYSRAMTAYVWYCVLTGVDQLEEIKLTTIPKAFLKSAEDKSQDVVLTDMEKAVMLEAVNNALRNPMESTQSQYTEAQ